MARTIDRTKIVIYRKEFLRQMDDYVKNIIGNETIIQEWLTNGLPDDYDDIDLEEIASDDELWLGCVNCFANCCKAVNSI